MSDFLTNLVVRSFSPAASFQPMVESTASYVEPQEAITEQPVTVTAKSPVQATDAKHEDEPVEAASPLIEMQPEPVRGEILVTDQKIFEPVKHEFQEKSVVPPPLETPAPVVKSETTPSIESPQPVIQSPVQHHQPSKPQQVMRKPASADPSPVKAAAPPSPPPVIKPRLRTATTRTHRSEPPIVEQVVEHVTEHLTQQVIERPAVTVKNHQEINKQEITSSFTTLVPKPAVQPLPAPHVRKTRNTPSLAQPSDEVQPAAALPPETVVNVAIGRIEVRATPTTTPRRERQSPGPKVMTLDDYVQQRSRGAK
jgi:hypothetical protein